MTFANNPRIGGLRQNRTLLKDLKHIAYNTKQPKALNKDNLGVNRFVPARDFGYQKTIPTSKDWLYRFKQPFWAMKNQIRLKQPINPKKSSQLSKTFEKCHNPHGTVTENLSNSKQPRT